MLDHFSRSELACPTTDHVRLAAGFGEALEKLRIKLDGPIYLTSACRSPSHNAMIREHPRSLHLIVNGHYGTGGTCAVDVAAADGECRAKLITLALDQDWSVGVSSNFIHLDQFWLSAISAVSRLFGALKGLYRDWPLHAGLVLRKPVWPPSKPDRLGPGGWRKSLPI